MKKLFILLLFVLPFYGLQAQKIHSHAQKNGAQYGYHKNFRWQIKERLVYQLNDSQIVLLDKGGKYPKQIA